MPVTETLVPGFPEVGDIFNFTLGPAALPRGTGSPFADAAWPLAVTISFSTIEYAPGGVALTRKQEEMAPVMDCDRP